MAQGFSPHWPAQTGWGGMPAHGQHGWTPHPGWSAQPARGAQPKWGVQPGWGVPGQFPPQPPKRRGPAPFILAALGLIGVIMIGLIAYSLFDEPDYQNDDYVPPPAGNVKPFPDALVSEVDGLVADNPLYSQEVAVPIRCDLNNPDVAVLTATNAEIREHLDELMACTMRVWDQPFRGTERFELVRPIVNVYSGKISSPCGTAEGINAFYCPANQEVYYGRELAQAIPSQARPRVIDATMAHEFGHSMQGRTLILHASAYQQQNADKATALEISRRRELQADCFAGMYIRAVAASAGYNQQNIDDIMDAFFQIAGDVRAGRPGDPRAVDDHGQGQSRLFWTQVGLNNTDVGQCNTFVAPSHEVR